jgi:excisionase family DNA binding protein
VKKKRWIRTREIAERLDVSRSLVLSWLRSKRLNGRKRGKPGTQTGGYRVSMKEFLAFKKRLAEGAE